MIHPDKKPENHRVDRVIAIIEQEAAKFISHEAGTESLITVIRAKSMQNGERVIVFVSVFPTEKSKSALTFLEHQREAFSNHLKNHVNFRLPRIDFLLDNGEGNELLRGPGGN